MRSYFIRIPKFADLFFPQLIWRIKTEEVYLTFDDGPDPLYTPLLLDILSQHKIRCTFFLLTEKCHQFPQLVEQIKDHGHAIGFHGHSHEKLSNLSKAEFTELASPPLIIGDTHLFRPAFGKITRRQAKMLSNKYKIIMYTLVIGDFDSRTSDNQLLQRMKRVRPGDIVLLHENEKTLRVLKAFLEMYSAYKFNSLNCIN
jgi:peptidoglycan/xylan/chitin deacetylase (PgdA/CDA1 family)